VIISNNSTFKLAWLPLAVLLGFSAACSDDVRTPTAPTAPMPPAVSGLVTGLVRGEGPPPWRHFSPHPVLSNATVTVVGGPASGTKTTTRADGTFEVTAADTFKLRFEHPMFVTTETAETVMSASAVTIPEVTLLTAPWSISGRLTDSLGNPVPDAEVALHSAHFDVPYGTGRSDAEGRYTVHSTMPHAAWVYVVVTKPGFKQMQEIPEKPVQCCGAVPDIRLIRIVSITPTAPSSLRVGESVEMPASVVVFDNGETKNIYVLPTSSVPTVVNVLRSDHWYKMTGFRAGVATLTFDLWGAIATLQVQVR
jgi:Carboxypeptidase regulatory-like domain